MRLFDRFINVADWPLSRRVFMLGLLGVVSVVLGGAVNHFTHSSNHSAMLDLSELDGFLGLWILFQLLALAVSVPAARRGSEGRLSAYVFVTVHAFFIVGLLHLFGTMSTPLVAILPALVIMWALFLDERVGAVGLGGMALWTGVVHALESSGELPFAPVLRDRSIDAQASGVWFASFSFNIMLLIAVCLFFCMVVLRARRVQDRRLREAHDALERGNRLICRYLPTQLAEQISRGDYQEALKPERRRLTIVFSDIQGFTSASEQLDAEELAATLNEYLSEMTDIADRYSATVNQLLGDGMMIFFGAPTATDDRDHALRAVRMALDMQRRLCELRASWELQGVHRPFHVRIGINTGYASVGDFGSAGRKLYSAIGLQTNLAARIQSHCEPGGVLLSQSTWSLVQDQIPCRPRGEINAKGVLDPVPVFEVALAA